MQVIAAGLSEPPGDETRTPLNSALRYFREAAPKHNVDEEESLFPRLRQTEDPRAQSALNKLTALEDEHRWATPLHEDIDQLGKRYLSERQLSAAEIAAFRSAIDRLASMYRQHIAIEDDLIFPCAVQVLSQGDKDAIAKEMASRRNLSSLANSK